MKHFKQNIFFISDLHFCHKKILDFDKRPFPNIDDMNECLINNWNSVVKDGDIVYFLGDFSFSGTAIRKEIADSLNGTIYFILGNHDSYKNILKTNRFEDIISYGTEIYVKDESIVDTERNGGFQMIVLSHYPIIVWNKCHVGSWMLHAHTHGSLYATQKDILYRRKIEDVGCNVINYTPKSYVEIREIMNNRVIIENYKN